MIKRTAGAHADRIRDVVHGGAVEAFQAGGNRQQVGARKFAERAEQLRHRYGERFAPPALLLEQARRHPLRLTTEKPRSAAFFLAAAFLLPIPVREPGKLWPASRLAMTGRRTRLVVRRARLVWSG
jgi:hypothetical protein